MSSVLLLALSAPALALEPDENFEIGIRRDWGFGMGSLIQGRFTLRVSGLDDLVEVRYMIDGQLMGAVSQAPFSYQFHTDNFPTGTHEIYAIGIRANGQETRSQSLNVEFVSGEEAGDSVARIIVPLIIGIAVISILAALLPMILGKNKDRFILGQYGPAGGAVCPACGLPYSRLVMSPNLVLGKLSRCPHCGKWTIARRATPAELNAAEARYRQDQEEGRVQLSDRADDLRRQLDESRFED
jgi:hypothetical protein